MKKSPRNQTFEESGVTLMPLKSFPSPKNSCTSSKGFRHEYIPATDGYGNKYKVCTKCGNLPLN